ncbi:Peroxisomal biogenesis factor 11 (PEX11) [Seminavis robusta]|uniref:Peroxisomal biogenesis factor 11 (PEX11) n=1 Tax=Seminavis robusta TaxID=568900 RepID=A0A9N8HQJ2_9STRA|nr:Peroxisomal biogenesis factor 11 (PEX11) [Seminavis robusta]|eukprot:Sro990_g228580.1 Peroxisomal biogenesis factor 11 (PEX11) (362) ;mRNA; r:18370-19542
MPPDDDHNDNPKTTKQDGDTKPSLATPLADFKFPENQENKNDNDKNNNEYPYPPKSLPLISLKEGLQKKATPWTLASWVKLALTLDGRDKITKVCQYSARMLAWWFAGQTNQVKRFKALQASLTTSRKAYRLGRSLIEIQKIRDSGLLELFFFDPTTTAGKNIAKADPAWKIIGSALKIIGLLGFWAGDNVNFLTGSGLFDDYRVESQKERITRRNQLKTKASLFANRCYFLGAVAGLVTSLRVYLTFRQTTLQAAQERLVATTSRVEETRGIDDDDDEHTKSKQLWNQAKQALDAAKEKQFSIFVTLLKSCVDVMVFSNNPGIDLHKKFRGKKNHEGFHCVCGLISATTVLYNNFPNAKK